MVHFTKIENEFDKDGYVLPKLMEIVHYDSVEAAVQIMDKEFFSNNNAREIAVQKNGNGGIIITIYNAECKIIKRLKTDV
jgi:hypothetical protein